MASVVQRALPSRPTAGDPLGVLVALLAAAAAVLGVAFLTGAIPDAESAAVPVLVAGPLAILILVAVLGEGALPTAERVLFPATVVAAAGVSGRYVSDAPFLSIVPAGLALTALGVRRRPGATFATIVAFTAVYGSLEIYTKLPVGPTIDLLLAGLWLAALWTWAFGGVRPPPLHPGLVVVAFLCVVNLVFAVLAPNLAQGIYGFRAMSWYMLAGILAALLLTDRRQQEKVLHAFLLAATAGAAYAVLRWIIGPGADELAVADQGGNYVLNTQREVRVFGALLNPSNLGTYCALGVSGCLAIALFSQPARWRVLAVLGAGLSGAAMLGAESRTPIVATAVGLAGVLVLFAVSRAATGRRIVPLTIGLVLAGTAVGVFAATELTNDRSRFRGLLNITNDYSYKERVEKWQSFLSDMPDHPLGHGLGSTGQALVRYGRFQTVANYGPDSSFVKVAYDQGYAVMGLFIFTLLALLVALAVRAVGTADPWAAARALAGFGTLLVLVVLMIAGEVNEGLPALAVWLLCGLGLAPVTE